MRVQILTLLFLLAACGQDSKSTATNANPIEADREDPAPESDTELGQQIVAKLKECKLYEPRYKNDVVRDEFDRCFAKCVMEATCADLTDVGCSDAPSESNPALSCFEQCPKAPADGFDCGDGTTVAHRERCDGFRDCKGGEDERDCPPYVCADGEMIEPGNMDCDQYPDCEDQSDEAGCAKLCR